MSADAYFGRRATICVDSFPYCIPLLHVVLDDEMWLHDRPSPGHVRANVRHEARVCFEIDEPGEIFSFRRFERNTSIVYPSVVVFGRIRIAENPRVNQRYSLELMANCGISILQSVLDIFPRADLTGVYAITILELVPRY